MPDEGLDAIPETECLRLLAAQRVGRVAVVDQGDPVVFPVNYRLDGRDVLFRTAEGTKHRAAARGARVAFEIDVDEPVYRGGWSVLVVGSAHEVADPDHHLDTVPPHPWAGGSHQHLVRIRPDRITGRRIRLEPR